MNVSVTSAPDCGMRLIVEDDGVGRATTTNTTADGGLGMRIMQHRAVVIGGALSVADRPVRGTIVTCTVPCPGGQDCPKIKEHHNG